MELLKKMREKISELEHKKTIHNFEEDSAEAKLLNELRNIEENYDRDEDKIKAIAEMKERDPNYNWIDIKQI